MADELCAMYFFNLRTFWVQVLVLCRVFRMIYIFPSPLLFLCISVFDGHHLKNLVLLTWLVDKQSEIYPINHPTSLTLIL